MKNLLIPLFVFMCSGVLLAVTLTRSQEVTRQEFDDHTRAIRLLAQVVDELQQREVARSGKEVRR